MKIVATIEARMTSSRLPGKVIMKVKNKTLLEYLIDRLKQIKEIDDIILCTTKNHTDDILVKKAMELKVKYYRGSENNVLSRVVGAVKKFKADAVIQITADCPIIDYKIIKNVITIFKKNNFDCVSNAFIRSFPDGMDVNMMTVKESPVVKKNEL